MAVAASPTHAAPRPKGVPIEAHGRTPVKGPPGVSQDCLAHRPTDRGKRPRGRGLVSPEGTEGGCRRLQPPDQGPPPGGPVPKGWQKRVARRSGASLCRPFGTWGGTGARVRRLKPPATHYAPFGSKRPRIRGRAPGPVPKGLKGVSSVPKGLKGVAGGFSRRITGRPPGPVPKGRQRPVAGRSGASRCRPFGTWGGTGGRVRRLKPPATHYAPFGSKRPRRPRFCPLARAALFAGHVP